MELTKEQKAGFKLLLTHIKRKYPFVISIIPNFEELNKYGSLMGIDIKFDLNKFYDITNTEPPKHYLESKYLLELLHDKGGYLFRYVDSENKDEFGSSYSDEVERHLNEYYKRLPGFMKVEPYHGWSDEKISDLEKERDYTPGWVKRMYEGESIKLSITYWLPVFDKTKYDTTNN